MPFSSANELGGWRRPFRSASRVSTFGFTAGPQQASSADRRFCGLRLFRGRGQREGALTEQGLGTGRLSSIKRTVGEAGRIAAFTCFLLLPSGLPLRFGACAVGS